MRYHRLRKVEYRHHDRKAICQQIRRDKGFEYPFEYVERIKLVHVVFLQNHLDQLIHKHKRQDHAGDRDDNGFGQILDHRENAAVPALRRLTDLRGYVGNLTVDRTEYTLILALYRVNHARLYPVG